LKTRPAEIITAVKAALGITPPDKTLKIKDYRGGVHFTSTLVQNIPNHESLRIKTVASTVVSRFFPHRLLTALVTEESMAKASTQGLSPYGVCILHNDNRDKEVTLTWLPSLSEPTRLCLVYRFREDLRSLGEILNENMGVKDLTKTERLLLQKSAEALHLFHSRRPDVSSPKELTEIYNLSLSQLMGFAGEFAVGEGNNVFLTARKSGRLLLLIHRTLHYWQGRGDRVGSPTGDLQLEHILLGTNDEIVFIDLSRFPLGEARGFDLGWFITECLWEYYRTGNIRMKKIGESFLRAYEKKCADAEIRKVLLVGLGIKALVLLRIHGRQKDSKRNDESEDIRGRISIKKAQLFYREIIRLLTEGVFSWG